MTVTRWLRGHQQSSVLIDADAWRSVRKPLISDNGPVARGFYEHPRLAVTIPCAILVRILRNHLGPLRTVRRPGSGTKQR